MCPVTGGNFMWLACCFWRVSHVENKVVCLVGLVTPRSYWYLTHCVLGTISHFTAFLALHFCIPTRDSMHVCICDCRCRFPQRVCSNRGRINPPISLDYSCTCTGRNLEG